MAVVTAVKQMDVRRIEGDFDLLTDVGFHVAWHANATLRARNVEVDEVVAARNLEDVDGRRNRVLAADAVVDIFGANPKLEVVAAGSRRR